MAWMPVVLQCNAVSVCLTASSVCALAEQLLSSAL
jgi:hypothetical protein